MKIKSFNFLLTVLMHYFSICESLNVKHFFKAPKNPVNPELVDAINFIIERVFLTRFSTVNIITSVEDPKEPDFISFKDALLKRNKGTNIYRMDNHTHIQTIRFRLKIYNVILIDSFKSFEILYKSITPNAFNFYGYYLFVLVNGFISETPNIFKAMWQKNIVNVNIIYDWAVAGSHEISLWTYRPFKPRQCGDTSTYKWASFKSGRFDKSTSDLFQNKFKKMFNCEVRLVTFNRCPASCISENGKTATGFDIALIDTIAAKLNFKLKKTILAGSEQWGTIVKIHNVTITTGALNKLLNNESDIAIGNYLLRESRLAILDPSAVYYNFPIVMVIPPGTRLTAYEKLLRPFELYVWIALLVTFAVGALVIFIVSRKDPSIGAFVFGSGNQAPIMNMLIAIYGGSQTNLPRRNFSRFLLMMFLLFCLVKRNSYQGALFIFLQTDGRNKEVETIDEMADKDFEFFMFDSYTDLVWNQKKIYNR